MQSRLSQTTLSSHRRLSAAALALGAAILWGSGCAPAEIDLDEADEDGAWGEVPYAPASEPAGYYASATGKTGAALLDALAQRISGHRSLGYNQARDTLFGSVADPQGRNDVECFYTGRHASPVTNSSTAYAKDINTEHVWPQSLGAAGAGKSDLHHLYPTDEVTNSRRGNYPFGEVSTVTWTAPNLNGADASRLGRSASGRTVFEPEARSKGNIARALLYFYTRYKGQPPSGFTVSNLQVEKAVLLKWHAQDPPDAEERARNDAIYGAQGNRNPYIDHPEFAASIPLP